MELILLKSASVKPSLHATISKSWTETFPLLSQTNESKQDSIFYAWLVIWPISTKWLGPIIHLTDEFRSKDNINFRNDYKAIIRETFTLCIYFKRRNSANRKTIFEWRKMSFFNSINFGHNSWTKASTLEVHKVL